MLTKSALALGLVAFAALSQPALALNPQPLPPGRAFRSMLNPQPLPPGRAFQTMLNPQPLPPGRAFRSMLNPQPLPPGRSAYGMRLRRLWICRSVQIGDPRKQPPARICGWR